MPPQSPSRGRTERSVRRRHGLPSECRPPPDFIRAFLSVEQTQPDWKPHRRLPDQEKVMIFTCPESRVNDWVSVAVKWLPSGEKLPEKL